MPFYLPEISLLFDRRVLETLASHADRLYILASSTVVYVLLN